MKPRILVLDDEAMLRQLYKAMLELFGFECVATEDGNETIKAYQTALDDGRPYSVVILDLTVPNGMGGHEAFTKLKALDPSVKAVVSSGLVTDPLVEKFSDYGYTAALLKPFGAMDLKNLMDRIAV